MDEQLNNGKQKPIRYHELVGLPYLNPSADQVEKFLTEGEQLVGRAGKQLRQTVDDFLNPICRLKLSVYNGIGLVRCLYYRELILSTIYSALTDGTSQAGTSYFVASGVRRHQNDWLIYDRFLANCLTSLGTSWEAVEAAMLSSHAKESRYFVPT